VPRAAQVVEDQRQPQLAAEAEVPRFQDRAQSGIVGADELAVAEHRAAAGLKATHLRREAELVDERAHVTVAARHELRAAIDDELTVALAAHTAARRVVALDHIDVEPILLERIGGGEARDAAAYDDDLPRHGQSVHTPASEGEAISLTCPPPF
jgi:hypothetical protein